MNRKFKYSLSAIMGSFFLIPILCVLLILFSAVSNIDQDNDNQNQSAVDTLKLSVDQYKFIMKIVDYSYQSRKENDFLTSVTVAQAIVESSWGQSNVALHSNNLFGIKKGSWKGSAYKGYRRYASFLESVKDHDKLLCGKSYGLKGIKDIDEITTKLQQKYAPESDGNAGYKNQLLNIIEKYDLTQFDELNELQLELIRSERYTMSSFDNDYTVEGESQTGNEIARKALTRLGLIYCWGGCHSMNEIMNPDHKKFDCSGLVCWSYYQAGVNIGAQTTKTLAAYTNAKDIDFNELQPGDILLYSTNGKLSGVHHVTLYIGNNTVVHAPSKGKPITTKSSESDKKHLYKCRRLY